MNAEMAASHWVTSARDKLGDALRRPKRHPVCRRRETQSGSCTERENLAGDAKGKGPSGLQLRGRKYRCAGEGRTAL